MIFVSFYLSNDLCEVHLESCDLRSFVLIQMFDHNVVFELETFSYIVVLNVILMQTRRNKCKYFYWIDNWLEP